MATDNKYDRQLRLWGANGQKKLSESCIVLVNATAAGTETIKNLVLPGIGRFHIIDDSPGPAINSSEPFSNFFVFDSHSKESENGNGGSSRSRAEIATEHLSELNPDVTGSFTAVDSLESADYASILSSLISSDSGIKHSNLLVVAADLPSSILQTISSLCWNGLNPDDTGTGTSSSIPLVIVKSYGLIGSVRLQTPYHPIVESKPDNANADLRLASTSIHPDSFPELNALKDSINLESLESHEHNHVPYVILLLKAMDQWRKEVVMASASASATGKANDEETTARLPKTFAEKNEFRKVMASMARNMNQELNFIEADRNYYMAYTELDMDEVQELIDSVEDRVRAKVSVSNINGNGGTATGTVVDTFDVLLLALKKFMLAHQGFPPLNGSIPDMAASTQGYIELQGIYKNKAQKDKEDMEHMIHAIGKEYGTDVTPIVTDDELTIFCKNIYNIRLTKTRSYEQEYTFDFGDEKDEILGEVMEATYDAYEVPDHTPLLWFIALRACDAFYDQHGHYPGQDGRELALESDANDVQKHIVDIVETLGLSENELVQSTLLSEEEEKKNAYAKEMTRYNNAEVHNIASVVGGVASQEAVKMITGQYIPIDGNYIFNGIAGVAGIFKL